jgi:Family of unknown function (DUF5677)
MPLLEHGFLGAEGDQTRQQILQKYANLFALLKDFNGVCHEYVRTLKFDYQSVPQVYAITYFIRGLMTFQSLVILSEHGCVDDVRALCRTLLQAYFRLAAISADPTVINQILASSADLQKQRLKLYQSGALKIPPDAGDIDFNAKIAELDAYIQKLGGSKITERELATISGRFGDYPAYLVLSDAAHTSPTDLQSFLKRDQNRSLLGFIYGPHDKDLMTYAVYAMSLQADNLINLDKVIKFGLPASFADIQNRSIHFRSDMPGMFDSQS